jgi:hypothetical protein
MNKCGVVDCLSGGIKMEGTKIKWHYNYCPTNFRNAPTEFVPMIKDKDWLDKSIALNTFRSVVNGKIQNIRPQYLLSVNEPDVVKGPNQMTIKECLNVHKGIEITINPILLGSPAITKIYGIPYLQEFLKGTNDYKPRCDFICVHWYDYNAEDFIKHIELVWSLFQKPIWVTEFSIVDWKNKLPINEEIINKFIDIAIPFLENCPYVHRYSWFSSNKNENVLVKSSIIDFATNNLNASGIHYTNKQSL